MAGADTTGTTEATELAERARQVLPGGSTHAARQAEYLATVKRGDFSNAWVDRLLEQIGCRIDEEPAAEDLTRTLS